MCIFFNKSYIFLLFVGKLASRKGPFLSNLAVLKVYQVRKNKLESWSCQYKGIEIKGPGFITLTFFQDKQ